MTTSAPGALAAKPSSSWAAASLVLPAASETALPASAHRRAAAVGLLLAALALAVATVLALLILAGPFHTSLGSIG